MKSYKYKSITNILSKQLNRKIFDFMDYGEIHRIKYPNNLYQFQLSNTTTKKEGLNNEKIR